MISLTEPTVGKGGAHTCQLKIILMGTTPPVWRRLQVPSDANLGWLHAVIQVAMGWTNSHLHQFEVGGRCYSDPDHNVAEFEGDPEIGDEWKFLVQQVAPKPDDIVAYEYDFGDSWQHLITVEKILPAAPAAPAAVCVGGARACPPEDCGGVWGYKDLLKALKNPKHPEHRSLKEWLGRPFDAEAFDLAQTNRWLQKLKWPRVTEAQLRKVLMARDGYDE